MTEQVDSDSCLFFNQFCRCCRLKWPLWTLQIKIRVLIHQPFLRWHYPNASNARRDKISCCLINKDLTHSYTMTPFDAPPPPPGNKPFENTVGKGEIARNEQFLLFPQCFLPVWIISCHFRQI